jgi:hypothetical protein
MVPYLYSEEHKVIVSPESILSVWDYQKIETTGVEMLEEEKMSPEKAL